MWAKSSSGRLRLDIRKSFFTQRVEEHRNRLPREVIMAPKPATVHKPLDNILRHMM